MRRYFVAAALATLTACANDKPAPGAMTSDSATVAPAADSTARKSNDSAATQVDSVMARDTAKGL